MKLLYWKKNQTLVKVSILLLESDHVKNGNGISFEINRCQIHNVNRNLAAESNLKDALYNLNLNQKVQTAELIWRYAVKERKAVTFAFLQRNVN